MDRFSFRAWDEQSKKMVFGVSPTDKFKYPIMQYTGLYDRKGVPIYEGDLLHHLNRTFPITVKCYHAYRFMWGKGELVKADAVYGEVRGNIYETPELINGENND